MHEHPDEQGRGEVPSTGTEQGGADAVENGEEITRLRQALAACRQTRAEERLRYEHDLYQARHELAQARRVQEELSEKLHGHEASRVGSGSASTPAGHARPPLPRRVRNLLFLHGDRRLLQKHIRLLHQSDLFDGDWYLAEYPDVAATSVDPAEHYLRFGAHEGRNPGPLFHGDEYLREHPELADGHVNPLIHYLQTRGSSK